MKKMMKAKGMAKGGKRGGAKKKMMYGGKMKPMAGGGRMKAKGMAKGGANGGKKKAPKKPTMTLASIRSAAKAKGYKLVRV